MATVSDSFETHYPAEAGAVARARTDLARFAAAAGAGEAQLVDVRLAVSEAITNAVLHGYRGEPGEVRLTAETDGSTLWVRVRDDGYGMRTEPSARSTGMGAGLGVISRIAEELSVAPRRHGGTDLRMRFELDRAPALAGAL